MSFLPFVFTIFVYKQNPEHFLVFRDTQTGKILIVVAVVLQVLGMFLIKVFGKLKV